MSKEEEIKQLLLQFNSDISRRIEHLELEFFSLTQLLLYKGIITPEDYELWLSEDAFNKLLDIVNKELGDYDD